MKSCSEAHTLLLGCGFTLSRLAKRLPQNSFVVTATTEEKCAELRHAGMLAERVNVESATDLRELLQKYTHLNTLIDSVPPIEDSARSAEAVSAAIAGSSIRRVFYLSTSGVFGGVAGDWVDQTTKPNPLNEKAQARLACEQSYRKLETYEITVTCFRIPAIYNEERGLQQALRNSQFRIPEDGDSWSNRIHVDDLVEVLFRALRFPITDKLPVVIPVCDDEPAKYREVVEFYCKKLGIRMPESVSREEIQRKKMSHFATNQRVSNRLMKELLGVELKFPTYRSS